MNLITAVYTNEKLNVPIGFELVRNNQVFVDAETGCEKRKAEISKNERFRNLVVHACRAEAPFWLVVADNGYSSAEHKRFIKGEKKKDFIFGLKIIRKVAFTAADAKRKQFVPLAELDLTPGAVRAVWIENVLSPVQVACEIYVNKDKKKRRIVSGL